MLGYQVLELIMMMFFLLSILTWHSQNWSCIWISCCLRRFLLPFCRPIWRRANRRTLICSGETGRRRFCPGRLLTASLTSAVSPLLSFLCTFSEWAKTLHSKRVPLLFFPVFILNYSNFSLSLVPVPPDTFLNTLFLLIANLDYISADISQTILIHKTEKRWVFSPPQIFTRVGWDIRVYLQQQLICTKQKSCKRTYFFSSIKRSSFFRHIFFPLNFFSFNDRTNIFGCENEPTSTSGDYLRLSEIPHHT